MIEEICAVINCIILCFLVFFFGRSIKIVLLRLEAIRYSTQKVFVLHLSWLRELYSLREEYEKAKEIDEIIKEMTQ